MSAPRNVRQWYHKHGVPLREEDWGDRFENGESATPSRATEWYGRMFDDNKRTQLRPFTAGDSWWWELLSPLWPPREDRETIERLEAFFAPYIALLPYPKGNLIRQLFNDRLTYAEAAEGAQLTRQGAYAATRRAVRALTRLVANDDPDFVPPTDGRRRDYEAERAAAWRVYDRYTRRQDDNRTDAPVREVRDGGTVPRAAARGAGVPAV